MSRAADCQARRANILSKDSNYKSPYQERAMEAQKYEVFNGGRVGDITVIVAQYHREVHGQPRIKLIDDNEYFIEPKYRYTTADGEPKDK
jgi:hypothetical protein